MVYFSYRAVHQMWRKLCKIRYGYSSEKVYLNNINLTRSADCETYSTPGLPEVQRVLSGWLLFFSKFKVQIAIYIGFAYRFRISE